MAKQRNSSLETVRLVCVFYVVFWHALNPYLDQLSFSNMALCDLVISMANKTNPLFMLLSGYFGIKLNIEKLLKLDLAIIFYDLLYLIFFGDIGVKSLLTALMPITFKAHWFLTYYFVIALLSGFLNQISEKLDRATFRNLLLSLITLFYIIPTFLMTEVIEDSGKGVVCMSIVYLVGRYIRKYYSDVSFKKSHLAIVYVACILIPTVMNLGLISAKGVFMSMYSRDNSIFMLVEAIVFFLFFREMHFTNRLINRLAPNVVILYCIDGYARELATPLFNLADYATHPSFVLIAFVYSIIMIVALLLISELRTLLFDRVDSFIAAKVAKLIQTVSKPAVRFAGAIKEKALAFLIVTK